MKTRQYCSRNVAINIQSDSIVRQTNKVYLLSYITMNNDVLHSKLATLKIFHSEKDMTSKRIIRKRFECESDLRNNEHYFSSSEKKA